MKKVYRLLFILHLFVGIGALFGGAAAVLNPNSPMGIPTDTLKNSPFDNFLIPGVLLFSVIGIGNIISAITLKLKFKFQGYISGVFSAALVFWIIIQCIMLNDIVALHIIYLVIGLFEGVLSLFICFDQRLFPTNIMLNIFNNKIK